MSKKRKNRLKVMREAIRQQASAPGVSLPVPCGPGRAPAGHDRQRWRHSSAFLAHLLSASRHAGHDGLCRKAEQAGAAYQEAANLGPASINPGFFI